MAGQQVLLAGQTTAGRMVPMAVTVDGKLIVITKNKGYYATEAALNAAYPTATAGDYAIVGATDTVWVWDTGTAAWVDSGLGSLVTSVFTRVGDVVAAANDYTWAQINKGTSSIADIATRNHSDLTAGDGKDHSDVVLANTHRGLTNNPHAVTAAQVGVGNVPNIDTTVINLDPFFINGNGFAITTGTKGWIRVPVACNITGWEVTLDQAATFTCALWKDTYANFPPTVGDVLPSTPATSAAIKGQDLAVAPIACAAGDYIKANVSANDNAQLALVKLIANRT